MPDDAAPMEMPPVREFAPTEVLPSLDFDIASPDAPTAKETELAMPDFGALSLDAMDDQPAGVTLKSTDAPVAPKFKHDLSELERRIASLELVGEPGDAPVGLLRLSLRRTRRSRSRSHRRRSKWRRLKWRRLKWRRSKSPHPS